MKRLLKPHGTFFIFYQHPKTAKMRDVARVLRHNLMRMGFAIKHETATGQVYCLASTLAA